MPKRSDPDPNATVSIDVDPIDAHLAGYGCAGSPDNLVYERAVPRILDSLARHGIRATFFWIARDAAATAPLLRQVAAAGHEVASHTVSHPEAWRRFARAEVARELRVSKQRLEDASGSPVLGFRSPGWHGPPSLAEELVSAGYAYDASRFPSPLLGAMSAALWIGSRGRRRAALGANQWWASRESSVLASGLRMFPVSVTRFARFPVYHTLRYQLSDARFVRLLDGFAKEPHELSYPLHAVDALGLAEDGVDARMSRHPGMRLGLEAKLGLLHKTLAAISERFRTRPFAAACDPANITRSA